MKTRKFNFCILLLLVLALNPLTTFAVGPSENASSNYSLTSASALALPIPIATITYPASICIGQSFSVCVNGNAAGATYSWTIDPGNGNIINYSGVNQECYNITASGPQITVTVTVTDATGQASSTEVMTAINCCPNPNYWVNNTASILPGGTSYFGQTITIGGNFYVDQNLDLVNCTIDFLPNALITVLAGNTFTIKGCTLRACPDGNEMWLGIALDPTATFSSSSGSLIRDAQIAVRAGTGGNFQIEETTFDLNYQHIYVANFAGNHPGSITSSRFFCSGPLLSPFQGQRTQVGIVIQNVNHIQIGDPSLASNVNHFQTLDRGIKSYNSGVDIYNNFFDQFTLNPNQPFSSGFAIESNGNPQSSARDINIGGPGLRANTIQDSWMGIKMFFNVNMTISNNSMRNIDYRVFESRFVLNCILEISDNYVNEFGQGFMIETKENVDARISDNTLVRTGPLSTTPFYNEGISIRPFNPNLTSTVEIKSNFISNVKRGIYVGQLPNSKVELNHVSFMAENVAIEAFPETLIGIETIDADNIFIERNVVSRIGNNILPDFPLANKLTGVRVETSTHPIVQKNTTKFLGKGFEFKGSFGESAIIRCNESISCWTGMNFQNADIGNQGSPNVPSGNIWSNIQGPDRITGNIVGGCDWYHSNSASYLPFPYSVTGLLGVVTNGNSGCKEQGGSGPKKTANIDQENHLKISLYPNPNAGDFKIGVDGMTETGELKILDMFGKTVYQRPMMDGQALPIFLEEMANGIYLLQVETQGQVLTQKFTLY